MALSKEEYVSTTEFANRYNSSRPLDKDFMPLEPSFVKLLCEQGQIKYSVLPAHDGRKKDVYMIPASELESVDILLNGDKAVDEEKTVKENEKKPKLMTSSEVAEFLGVTVHHVNALARQGALKPEHVKGGPGKYGKNMFHEEDILSFAEGWSKAKRKSHSEITDQQINELKDYISKLEAEIGDLRKKNNELVFANSDLRDQLSHASKQDSNKDIFEYYRRGFKDGYEMGGGHNA